jgi:hypothetical protein
MRRDALLSATILAAACLAGRWLCSIDWMEVWVYDLQPWLTWDGAPVPDPVGEPWTAAS